MLPNEPNYRFDDFLLDVSNRQLWRGDAQIELNARYFDALVLLVREHGRLVGKDRFFAEVWGDVVVSDAALTQCIKDIRRQLGDDAANPRYIATVPRYGYRFAGTVETVLPGGPAGIERPREEAPAPRTASMAGMSAGDEKQASLRLALVRGVAGTLGGGIAGVLGGVLYGFGLAYTPADPRLGTVSILVVLISLSTFVGAAGGFGVGFGMAAAGLAAPRSRGWCVIGAAFGGMLVGGLSKLLGVDAFNLLFGQAPAGITGGLEGAALGAALALGAQLGGGFDAVARWRPVVGASLGGTAAGMLIPLAGGRLMGGSLELLARSFAGSRLQLDAFGRFFGELHFGYTTQVVMGGLEGLLFGSCVAGALVLALRAGPPGSRGQATPTIVPGTAYSEAIPGPDPTVP